MTQHQHFQPAWWLRNRHAATIWGRVGRREPRPQVRRERWDTPDGDLVELLRLEGRTPASPRVLLLHGLEGGVHSHYAKAVFREAGNRGWAADMLLFRSCGSEPNRLPRSYHSGETGDAAFVMERIAHAFPHAQVGLIGVSLGGNVLLKLLGERGPSAWLDQLAGAVAISVPFDLARASRQIGMGFGAVYEKNFLRTLIPKALQKIERHPELASLSRVRNARTIWEFDDFFTAPLHGFESAADYYEKSSSLRFLHAVTLPTLLLSAVDDPFLPPDVLDEVSAVAARNPALHVEFHRKGGHVGFVGGRWPWKPFYYAEWRAFEFLGKHFGN